MKVVQCSLTRVDGRSEMVCWLDQRPDLRKGVIVTLKGGDAPDGQWCVTSVGKIVKEKSEMKRSNVFDSIKPKR